MPNAIVSLVVATTLLLGSPGPATLALAATSGVFGFRGGLPFLAGILAGLALAIVLGAFGIAALFEAFPGSRWVVQTLGGLYVGYLAYKVATAPVLEKGATQLEAAPGIRDGFILNLLNPKLYAVFLALFSQFQLPFASPLTSVLATGFVVYAVAIAVDIAWLALGNGLRPVFQHPKHSRVVRVLFGVLMVAAVAWTFVVP